jgi:uncharacterized membrane protein YbaN (DUF454 family)
MDAPRPLRAPNRYLYLGIGYACLGLAVVGAVLPLMPTTVFLLIAAWAFGRANPQLREKLRNSPRFGPLLRDWEEHRAIRPRAKRAAVLGMAASWVVVAVVFRDLLASAIAGAILVAVAAYILTRPTRVE